MEYGLHHRRNDEKKYIKNFCRGKDFRKGRARAEKKIPQDFKVLNCKGDRGKDFRKGRARAEKKIPQDFKVLNCKGDKSFSKIALQ